MEAIRLSLEPAMIPVVIACRQLQRQVEPPPAAAEKREDAVVAET